MDNSKISTSAIGEALGISKRAVSKQTKRLQEQGRLHRIGPSLGGHWKITGKKDE